MIYVIGDIHGCLEPLKQLMGMVNPGEGDQLIFLGDYIDRGPDPKGVVEYLLSLKGNPVFLMGNHERMFLDYLEGRNRLLYLLNGGGSTLRGYGDASMIPADHLRFFKSLRLYYEAGHYLFVHAGLKPGLPLEDQGPEDLLWIRGEFISYPGRYPKTIVFGHMPMPEVLMLPDRIGIDTGCVYGGKLTCLVLPSQELIQVKNRWA
ncbi:MAG: serine/threonine protein phosphatase [candidate division NC10 bacterium]|nr:serine/threonine protein phosphatase [candidate division NC10 bacterium]